MDIVTDLFCHIVMSGTDYQSGKKIREVENITKIMRITYQYILFIIKAPFK